MESRHSTSQSATGPTTGGESRARSWPAIWTDEPADRFRPARAAERSSNRRHRSGRSGRQAGRQASADRPTAARGGTAPAALCGDGGGTPPCVPVPSGRRAPAVGRKTARQKRGPTESAGKTRHDNGVWLSPSETPDEPGAGHFRTRRRAVGAPQRQRQYRAHRGSRRHRP